MPSHARNSMVTHAKTLNSPICRSFKRGTLILVLMINYLSTVSVSATEAPGPFSSISTIYDISMFKALEEPIVWGLPPCAKERRRKKKKERKSEDKILQFTTLL